MKRKRKISFFFLYEILYYALDAIGDDNNNHDGPDAQSVGSASIANVSGHAMRSIRAVPDMRDKVSMDNYLIDVRNALSSVI